MLTVWLVEKRILRALGLSPMRRVLRGLKNRGMDVSRMQALDMFAGDGTNQVLCYCKAVRSLEAWDINPKFIAQLEKNVPNAVVKKVDSYKQLSACDNTFDMIVIDNSLSLYGPDGIYCEHFGLFPDIFRICNDEAVLVLTVATNVSALRRNIGIDRVGTPEHLRCRAQFYGVDTPENISLETMVRAYSKHCAAAGFDLQWWFPVRRRYLHTLVLKISRSRMGG